MVVRTYLLKTVLKSKPLSSEKMKDISITFSIVQYVNWDHTGKQMVSHFIHRLWQGKWVWLTDRWTEQTHIQRNRHWTDHAGVTSVAIADTFSDAARKSIN